MRYLLFIALLIVNFNSNADQVYGFDFGGKFTGHKKHKEITGAKLLDHAYKIYDIKFFDFAEIETNDKFIIQALSFSKTYKVNVFNIGVMKHKIIADYAHTISHLEERYGKFDVSNSKNILGYVGTLGGYYGKKINESASVKPINTDSIELIKVFLSCPEGMSYDPNKFKKIELSVTYLHKEVLSMLKKRKSTKQML